MSELNIYDLSIETRLDNPLYNKDLCVILE